MWKKKIQGRKLDEVRAESFNERVGVKVNSKHVYFKDKISELVSYLLIKLRLKLIQKRFLANNIFS